MVCLFLRTFFPEAAVIERAPLNHCSVADANETSCVSQGRRIPFQDRSPHRRGYRSGIDYATSPANVVRYENMITRSAYETRLPRLAPESICLGLGNGSSRAQPAIQSTGTSDAGRSFLISRITVASTVSRIHAADRMCKVDEPCLLRVTLHSPTPRLSARSRLQVNRVTCPVLP